MGGWGCPLCSTRDCVPDCLYVLTECSAGACPKTIDYIADLLSALAELISPARWHNVERWWGNLLDDILITLQVLGSAPPSTSAARSAVEWKLARHRAESVLSGMLRELPLTLSKLAKNRRANEVSTRAKEPELNNLGSKGAEKAAVRALKEEARAELANICDRIRFKHYPAPEGGSVGNGSLPLPVEPNMTTIEIITLGLLDKIADKIALTINEWRAGVEGSSARRDL